MSFWLVLVFLVLLLSGITAQLSVKPLDHLQIHVPFSASPTTPLPVVPVAAKSFGIAAGSSLMALDQTALDLRLQGMKDMGASWIRFDFNWALIQLANSHDYDWSGVDRVVAATRKQHINILGIIDYTPAWARPSLCQQSLQCAPTDTQQSRLLRQSYAAIKQAEPQAFVLTGGLSPQPTNAVSYSPVDFFNALYASGAQGSFDAVSDHPYTFPLSPSSKENHAWNQMARPAAPSLIASLAAHGDGNKKIWITEFGAPTGGPGPIATVSNLRLSESPYVVDDALQAQILQDAVNLYRSYSWVGPFFYYSYQDAGTDQSTNENFFGLIRYNGTHKPAYAVFQIAASQSL